MNRFKLVGKIKPKCSLEIQNSPFSIGLEKLDRKVFAPNRTYDKLALLGAKRVRLQSGWMRTETKKGVYDFSWLDQIVDNLISRGLKPWVTMCYGNPLYTDMAKQVFGAVGCPPVKTDQEKLAWKNYCTAFANHFKDRISEFEVWNEPDGAHCWKHGISGTEYGNFAIETSKTIKSVIPNAKIFGCSFAGREHLGWLIDAFETGMAKHIDAVTFHDYCEKETRTTETANAIRAVANEYNPNIKLIQGETGCPSRSDGFGALMYGNWTEKKQAKLLLRRVLTELKNGVEFVSWFTAVDMIEALNGKVGDKGSYLDYGHFGVLRAQFDDDGFSIGEYDFKPSFYAYQNICSTLSDATVKNLPAVFHWEEFSMFPNQMTEEYDALLTVGFSRPNKSKALAYWKPTNVLTTEFESIVSIILPPTYTNLKIVDLLTGEIFAISEKFIEKCEDGSLKINSLPVKDYPLLLTIDDFVE